MTMGYEIHKGPPAIQEGWMEVTRGVGLGCAVGYCWAEDPCSFGERHGGAGLLCWVVTTLCSYLGRGRRDVERAGCGGL